MIFAAFGCPWAFLFLVPLAVAAWRLLRRGRRGGVKFSATLYLPKKTAGLRAYLAALSPWILLAGLALAVVAAARPRDAIARGRRDVDAIAIAMTVDVSDSMRALDLTPRGEEYSFDTTRLAVVKELFREFVSKRPDDLIGLVSFATYAATVCPLTADHDALLNALRGVEIPSQPVDENGNPIGTEYEARTAIGDGLATALARLKEAKPTSKIVILLSDGLSNTGAVEPDEAADAAAKLGIKVYAIGIGTHSQIVPFPQQRRDGSWIVTRQAGLAFDEGQLKSIAEKTGGVYFPVDDREALEKALDEIDRLEKTKLDVDIFERWDERFPIPLALGVALVLLAVSLSMAASRRVA